MMWTALIIASIAVLCTAQSTFTPLRPPSLPLAVRSPYLTTWQQAGSDGGNGGYLPGQWPTFWAGQVNGWTGYVRVDNISYIWMGDPKDPDQVNYYAIQTGYEYTSTQSIFTLDVAGQIEMTVTFLSPVLPETLLEMSLPYSYMDVAIRSLDGNYHQVQLYTDITAEWVSGDRSSVAQWSYGTTDDSPEPNPVPPVYTPSSVAPRPYTPYATATNHKPQGPPTHTRHNYHAPGQGHHPSGIATPPLNATKDSPLQPKINMKTGGVAYHKVWRQTQLEFHENSQQAEWGYWYYATSNDRNLTHQQGEDDVLRAQFINNGWLDNSQDTNYRAINDRFPVFAYAFDLGTTDKSDQYSGQSNTFQISLHQKNCIYFEGANGNSSVPCLWTNYFDNDIDALEYFYTHYDSILFDSEAVDSKVKSDSVAAAGDDYASLTTLAVRQAFGALAYTNSPSHPWVFLKEISSDGDIQTVDVIFPFHPITIYFNPDILRYILDPLFINQEAGFYPQAYSLHHLGTFPNATGFNTPATAASGAAEPQPLEESGNMILMTLAYAQRANDNAYLSDHYRILTQWNQYLLKFALIPEDQLSTDDFLGTLHNDTNLALKGIVGIAAMAQIANRTSHPQDAQNFSSTAESYISQWQNFAINKTARPPHTTAAYGLNDSYSILYNLYPDTLLGLDLVPDSVYEMQSNFYPTVFKQFGVPLRNTVTEAKLDWELWAAAIASESTRNQFISILATWLDQTPTNFAYTDFYDAITGDFAADAMFDTRPVVGGVFALLALQGAGRNG